MPNKDIKILKGHSRSMVELMSDNDTTWVRKSGDISRNLERMHALRGLVQMPNIIKIESDMYDMEYIPHTDMATWLVYHQPIDIINWIHAAISTFSKTEHAKDYLPIYQEKLSSVSLAPWWQHLPFSFDTLIEKLPRVLPSSQYHGDFTMDNILYNNNRGFFTIDPLTSSYDSWVFDLAKLAQDIKCGWFIRHTSITLEAKLGTISNSLARYKWWDNDYMVILMLLRILPYTQTAQDKRWLIGELNRLWKS